MPETLMKKEPLYQVAILCEINESLLAHFISKVQLLVSPSEKFKNEHMIAILIVFLI